MDWAREQEFVQQPQSIMGDTVGMGINGETHSKDPPSVGAAPGVLVSGAPDTSICPASNGLFLMQAGLGVSHGRPWPNAGLASGRAATGAGLRSPEQKELGAERAGSGGVAEGFPGPASEEPWGLCAMGGRGYRGGRNTPVLLRVTVKWGVGSEWTVPVCGGLGGHPGHGGRAACDAGRVGRVRRGPVRRTAGTVS